MKQITKSKTLQNCLKVTAAVVIASGVGYGIQTNHELKRDIDTLTSQNHKIVQDLKVSNSRIEVLEGQKSALTKQKTDLLKTNKALSGKLKDTAKEKNELKKDKQKLQQEKKSLQRQINSYSPAPTQIRSKIVTSKTTSKPTAQKSQSSSGAVKQTVHGVASAYTTNEPGVTGITASGKPVRVGMIAMARWVPLGTKVRLTVDGYPSVNGIYEVADRGGAIKGNRVDIYFTSLSEAVQFGMKDVKIEILH